jgi:Ras-related protein Rab-1A
VYSRLFGLSLNQEILTEIITSDIEKKREEENDKVSFIEKDKFRLSYIQDLDSDLLFLFVNDFYDDLNIIKKGLIEFKEKFKLYFEDFQPEQLHAEICQKFETEANKFQIMMLPKITIIGYHGVGKTTITELIRSKDIPIKQIASITGNLAILKFANYHISLWDYTGPEDLIFLWKNFVKESNIIFLITNGTLDNVEKSKFLLNSIKSDNQNVSIAVIANIFDTKKSIDSVRIENMLGTKTYPISATDPKYKYEIIKLIITLIGVNNGISEILNKVIRRERIIKDFEDVLKNKNFEVAKFLFGQVIKLSEEIGEDSQKMEFYKNKELIEEMIEKESSHKEVITHMSDQDELREKADNIPLVEKSLKKLLENYMTNVEGITAVVVCDREGFIITSESKREEEDDMVLGGIAVAVDSFIDRIKREFENISSFFNVTIIGDKKFAYCSSGKDSILTTISNLTTSESELRVYSEYVANKVELLLEGNENVSLEIPDLIKLLARTKDGKIPKGSFSTKLILTGDYAVGKTSLIARFVKNLFNNEYLSTIGVDILQKKINLSDNTQMNFVIWDIGGQITQMAPYRKKFYEGANSAFIVVDRTRVDSLKNVEDWYDEIIKHSSKDINIVIIGNKSDLTDEILVSRDDIKKVAEKYDFTYILTSAKTGENVFDAFLYCAYNYLEKV